MTNQDRHLGETPNDDEPYKAYPASVSSVFASLRQFWAAHSGEKPPGSKMSGAEFTKNPPNGFCEAFDYVADNFQRLDRIDKETKKRNYSGAAYQFRRIENGGKTARLDYEQVIIAAEWVGLSVAQFMAFFHFASTERRADNRGDDGREALKELLAEYEGFLDEIRDIIDGSDDEHVFYELRPEKRQKFYVKEVLLLRLAKAAGRKS